MNKMAVRVAVIGFFVLAGVGWVAGLSPLDCGIKAVLGAVALYILTTTAERMVVGVMVRTIISANAERGDKGEDISGGSAK